MPDESGQLSQCSEPISVAGGIQEEENQVDRLAVERLEINTVEFRFLGQLLPGITQAARNAHDIPLNTEFHDTGNIIGRVITMIAIGSMKQPRTVNSSTNPSRNRMGRYVRSIGFQTS